MGSTRQLRERASWRPLAAWVALTAIAAALVPGAALSPAHAIGTLSTSASSVTVRAGEPITVTFTAQDVRGAVGYSVDPPLPEGLSLIPAADLLSAQLQGSPVAAIPATQFTVTAVDEPTDPSEGSTSATANVVIRVDGHLNAVGSPATGSVLPPVTPALSVIATGLTEPVSYSTEPPLSDGLRLGADGVLAGTPAAPWPLTTFTVTAVDSAGAQATAAVELRVEGGVLTTSATRIVGELGKALERFSFGETTWPDVTFSVEPDAPAGLHIDASGALHWTPLQPLKATSYTVTALDSAGAIASVMVQLRVSSLSPPAQVVEGVVGQPLPPTATFIAAGLGRDITYSASLPPGLAIHPTLGHITGRPTTTWPTSDVVITATDAAEDAATALLTITVRQAQLLPPRILAVQAGSSGGSLRVLFTGASNAPSGQTYAAEVYDAGGTSLVTTIRPLSSAADITGLNPGTHYTVIVVADPLPGYVGSRSTARSGRAAESGTRLAAPVIISAVGGTTAGSLVVSFTPAPGAPEGQVYTARAFTDDLAALVASGSGGSSPLTLTGLTPGSRYYVVVAADATAVFLESPSRGRYAVASGVHGAPTHAAGALGAGTVLTSLGGVHVGSGWYVHPKSATATALRIRVRAMPVASAAKATSTHVPLNRAVALRVKRPRSTQLVGSDVRLGRVWVSLGPLSRHSSTTVDLPVIQATKAGSYLVRLRSGSGTNLYLKIMVTRQ